MCIHNSVCTMCSHMVQYESYDSTDYYNSITAFEQNKQNLYKYIDVCSSAICDRMIVKVCKVSTIFLAPIELIKDVFQNRTTFWNINF